MKTATIPQSQQPFQVGHWSRLNSIVKTIGYCLIPIFLIAATFFWYYPSLNYPFEFDDLSNIVKFFKIRHNTIRDLFFANSRWISYWLNAFYYGLLPEGHKFDPYLYRLGNVIIHCWAGFAIYCATSYMTCVKGQPFLNRAGTLIPVLATGLFLMHPVQTQTVSYVIQGQLEGLAGAFIFTIFALFLYAFSAERSGALRVPLLCMMWILTVLSCGSKEIIIVLPVLLVVADWFFIARGSWKALKKHWWMHAIVFVTVVGLYLYFLRPAYFLNILSCSIELPSNIGNMLTESRFEKITSSSFFISQGKVILHYLGIFIWPFAMSVDYDWKLSPHFLSPDCIIPFLLLAILAVYILRRLRKNSTDIVSFCLIWFFIAILPRSSIIPSTELLADYKTYTSSFGICLLLAYVISYFLLWLAEKKWWRGGLATVYALSSLLLMGVGYVAYQRNLVWKSAKDFWEDVIRHAPGRARAYNNYGVALCELGDHAGAIKNFKEAIARDDNYADPYNNLSVAYTSIGKLHEAIEAMRKGIRIMPTQPEGYNNLASILINMEDDAEVEKLLLQAIKIRPHYGKAYFNLGKWHLKHKRDQEAWAAFKAACTVADFDTEYGFAMYGHASLMINKFEDAVYAYSRALAMNPQQLEIAIRRALCAEKLGRHADVDKWFNELLAAHPSTIAIWIQYGDILFERNKPEYVERSIICYERANKLTSSAVIMCKIARSYLRLNNKAAARPILQKLSKVQLPGEIQIEVQRLIQELEK